jgi:hypothetical protein
MAEFAHLLNIRPWEWDDLLLIETYVLCANVDHFRQERKRHANR